MYKQHFRLTGKPFKSNAEGAAIFVGPQHAKVVNSLTKALGASDSVIVVSGAIGVGKTALVTRALETSDARQMVCWIGRMQLGPDEVLELLLAGFGVSHQPVSTIRRFAAFKRLMRDRVAAGTRVVIVVEDATRIGNDALLEIESLTATDAGDGSGANIILMGPPEIKKLIASPDLARLRQRSRLGQTIEPFNAAEVQGYLKHCIRQAGGNYDTIFDPDAADMVYRCSEGVARVVNHLSESALQAGAEGNFEKVTAALVQQVAAEVHGLEPVLPPSPAMPAQAAPATQKAQPAPQTPAPQPAAAPQPVAKPGAATEPAAPAKPKKRIPPLEMTGVDFQVPSADSLAAEAPAQPAPPEPEPEPEPAPEPVAAEPAGKRIPPLEMTGVDFQVPDTALQLEDSPATAAEPEQAPEPAPPASKPQHAPTVNIPALSEAALAELQPPEETAAPAASAAPAAAPAAEPQAPQPVAEAPEPQPSAAPEAGPEPLEPDLEALEAALSASHEAESPPDHTPPEESVETPTLTLKKALAAKLNFGRQTINRLASELHNATSLEDISEMGAETLFGQELADAASDALGPQPAKGTVGKFVEEPSPVKLDEAAAAPRQKPAAGPGPAQVQPKAKSREFDMTASQRLSMVKSWGSPNGAAAPPPAAKVAPATGDNGAGAPLTSDEMIEIEATLTQKCLQVIPPPADDPTEPENPGDKKANSFLGLFRR